MLCSFTTSTRGGGFSDGNWLSMGGVPGVNGVVYATVVDGAGNLYIGGDFTAAGDTCATNVAKWDGSRWTALGSGLGGPYVHPIVFALAVSGSNVYAGGSFTMAGSSPASCIARWDGNSWSALGSGIDGGGSDWRGNWGTHVFALATAGSDLYAGGDFATAGGNAANCIAKWNGSRWSALGSGLSNGPINLGTCVYALAISSNVLYAGGNFTTAGGNPANYIAVWDGSRWSEVSRGVDDWVYALAVAGSDLYAGGRFLYAGATPVSCITKLHGGSWKALSYGMSWGVYTKVCALAVSGNDVYAGGSFNQAGTTLANSIAKWDGSSWTNLTSGVGSVSALALSGTNLYVGGDFGGAGGYVAQGIAKWDGSHWSVLGCGLNDYVKALAVSGSNVYVGGYFTWAGGIAANRVAKWDGRSWSALGSGMGDWEWGVGSVDVLAVSGNYVYASGLFTNAGGSPATNIAKWDGNGWTPLGPGLVRGVQAMAVSGSDLFACWGLGAGDFLSKWDGTSWNGLGGGVNGTAKAMAVSGTDVYVGGGFTRATNSDGSTVTANSIAKWNGSSWSALGAGMWDARGPGYAYVHALAISARDLYAAGTFTSAGGSPATNIAKWNGSSWSALGSGLEVLDLRDYATVHALAVSGSNLYAGGYFALADGSPANYIAKWDASRWSVLGSGMGGGQVLALAGLGNDLYVGGQFTTAGGKLSPYIARAYLPELPTLSVLCSGANVRVGWPSADTAGFALEEADSLAASSSWGASTSSVTNDGTNKSVTLPTTNGMRFFRLRAP